MSPPTTWSVGQLEFHNLRLTHTSSSCPCLPCRINLFTNSLEGPVLDHRYYGGGCSPHYILDTRFRKPYNVESYTPQVGDSQGATARPRRGHLPRSWLA